MKVVCCGYVQGGQLLAAEQLFPGITLAEFAHRRKALRSYLPTESLVILAAAPVKQMTDVVPYPFRQDADYLYYTGCQQPEGIAVLDDHTDLCMFMPDRDPEVWGSVLKLAANLISSGTHNLMVRVNFWTTCLCSQYFRLHPINRQYWALLHALHLATASEIKCGRRSCAHWHCTHIDIKHGLSIEGGLGR